MPAGLHPRGGHPGADPAHEPTMRCGRQGLEALSLAPRHPAPPHRGVGRSHAFAGLERLPSSSYEEAVMQERAFGRTGLAVSALGFGSWPMSGGDRYGAIEDAEAIRAIC